MSKKPLSIREIAQDPKNLNLGSGEEGQALIDKSVETVGWGRSMVMSADGVMLAGNHALNTAQKRGDDPIIVESDGSRPIVVKRTDIKAGDKKARLLAILDNRTQQKNLNFDMPRLVATIEELAIEPAEVGFTDAELSAGNWQGDGPAAGPALTSSFQVVIELPSEEGQREMYERLTGEGYTVRLLTL